MTEPSTDRAPASEPHPIAQLLFGWVSWKHAGRAIYWGLAALSVFLILVDVAVGRHEKVHIADATGFYGFFGFLSFALVVLAGWPLGALLRRPETYYGEADEDEEGRS